MDAIDIDELVTYVGDTPERARPKVREALVLDPLRRDEVSSGRAAELLGIDRLETMRLQSASGIPVFDLNPDEIAAEQWVSRR